MKYVYSVLTLLLLMACEGRQQQVSAQSTGKVRPTEFVFPEIPQMMTDPGERLSFLMRHYWTEYDFADTVLLGMPEVSEQGFVNFINLFDHASEADSRAGIDSLVRLASPHAEAFAYLLDKAEKYLYDPSSPMRNEDRYVWMAEAFVQSPATPVGDKMRLQFRIDLARMNRVGERATDFGYVTPDGQAGTLCTTALRGDYLLLVFYDPECEHCQETLRGLWVSPSLMRMLAAGKVDALAVYTEGNETLWREKVGHFPKTWRVVNDARTEVRDKPLYDLKALPSLYLLGKDYKVLLKDAPAEAILEYLKAQGV